MRSNVSTAALSDFAIIYGKELRVHSFYVFLIFSFFSLTELNRGTLKFNNIKCYMTKYSACNFMRQNVSNYVFCTNE